MNKINGKYFFSILLISLFTLFSCNFSGEKLQNSETDNKIADVTICLNFGAARQISPVEFSASVYKLKGTYNEKETVWTYDSLTKLQSATLYLNYGEWSFTLEAYANDKLIATDTITENISETNNTLSFEYKVSKLNYSEGSGNINVEVLFPTDKKVASVTAALYTTDDLTTPVSNTTTTWTYFSTDYATGNYITNYVKNTVGSGSYYLVFKFYQAGIESSIGMWRDLVNVANGCTSIGSSTITDFNELYSINYHMNGISFKESYVAPATFNKSQSITLPTADNMDQTNLSFTGWYETSDFTGEKITSWSYDTKTTDVDVYARNTATVDFDMNSYGSQISSQTIVYGDKASEPEKPTNDSMFFKGWFSDEELTEKYNFNSTVNTNKTVYAKWVDLATYWSWSYPTSAPTLTWEGKGTEDDPYIIMNSQEFADLAYMVNNYTTYSGTYFELGSDIELNYGKTITGEDETLRNWTPIGNTTYNFAGNFNGNDKKINGLYINNDTLDYVGLFGIGNAPNNLTIESGYVKSSGTYTGGIIGYSKTAIENCVNKASLVSSKTDGYTGGITAYGLYFNSCCNYGEINSVGTYCGGICSYQSANQIIIKKCINYGKLCSEGMYLGGIVAYCKGSPERSSQNSVYIEDSINYGQLIGTKYIGGIVSYLNSSGYTSYTYYTSGIIELLRCSSKGNIESENSQYVGGICGYFCVSSSYYYTPSFSIQNCESNSNIIVNEKGNCYVGSIGGYIQGYGSSQCINIINCKSSGKIEDISSLEKTTIGGIVGSLTASKVSNCFSNSEISNTTETSIGGIVGVLSTYGYLTNCFYVGGKGATYAAGSGRSTTYESGVGTVATPDGSVLPSDGTTLLYNGTICEVLNAYIDDNDTDNSYKEWTEGEDGWPTFIE